MQFKNNYFVFILVVLISMTVPAFFSYYYLKNNALTRFKSETERFFQSTRNFLSFSASIPREQQADNENLQEHLVNWLANISPDYYQLVLIDGQGSLIYPEDFTEGLPDEVGRRLLAGQKEGLRVVMNRADLHLAEDKKKIICHFTRLSDSDLILAACGTREKVIDTALFIRDFSIITGAIALALTLCAYVFLNIRMRSSLLDIREKMELLTAGQVPPPLSENTKRSFSWLAEPFEALKNSCRKSLSDQK